MYLRFWKDKSGATAIEYALIASLIALAIIGGFGRAANSVGFLWGNNNSSIQQALQ